MTASALPARCVFDTDVLIGLLSEDDVHHDAALSLIVALDAANAELLVSAVNYGEVLTRPSQDPRRLMRAIDAVRAAGIEIVPVDAVTATVAAGIRAPGVSLADGFAITAAMERRAALATFDREARRQAADHGVEVLPR